MADPPALAQDVRAIAQSMERTARRDEAEGNRIIRRLNEITLSGPLVQRPAPGVADRFYFALDPGRRALYYDIGGEWVLVFSPTAEAQRATLVDGAVTHTFIVNQEGTTYVPTFSTTWFTMVRINAQSASSLTVEFSNPASAGDVLGVTIP